MRMGAKLAQNFDAWRLQQKPGTDRTRLGCAFENVDIVTASGEEGGGRHAGQAASDDAYFHIFPRCSSAASRWGFGAREDRDYRTCFDIWTACVPLNGSRWVSRKPIRS